MLFSKKGEGKMVMRDRVALLLSATPLADARPLGDGPERVWIM
jgi:hypothetical protein